MLWIILLIVVCLATIRWLTIPVIRDVWVVNLDHRQDRYENFLSTLGPYSEITQRWPATYGKTTTFKEAYAAGVRFVYMWNRGDKLKTLEEGIENKSVLGAIGCFMSHKRLLQHLWKQWANPYTVHFICEDDAQVTPETFKQWESIRYELPADFDICYFDIYEPLGERYSTNLMRAQRGFLKNVCTHAYVVRHGAIPTILAGLETFAEPIDNQYCNHFDKWKVYYVKPSIVRLSEEAAKKSDIV